MFCLDCHHRLTDTMEKAVGSKKPDDYRLVHESTLTGSWICEVTGNEHRAGDVHDYVMHLTKSVPAVLEMVESGDITAEQGLQVLAIDLGFVDRAGAVKEVETFVKWVQMGVDPDQALKLLEKGE